MEELFILNKNTDKLARNPLGIIALFIVLVYGIAGIVLGLSSDNLTEYQRTIFVLFLVMFPCLVLVSFLWLVAKHHTKLYAPSDYRNDEGFLGLLSPEQQKQRLDNHVEEVLAESAEEVEESSESQNTSSRSLIRESVYHAEDLAIREIESEFGVSINRQISLGRDVGLDGFFVKNNKGYAIQVKYAVKPLSRNQLANELHKIEASVSRLGWKKFGVMVVVVFDDLDMYDLSKEKERLSIATDIFPFDVDIRFYGLSQMKYKYGLL